MREIPLTRGKVALVDDEDYERLASPFRWQATPARNKKKGGGTWYAVRTVWVNGRKHMLRMHRVVLHAPDGQQVDHINGDGLDNRRSNLRFCTYSQNNANRPRVMPGKSGYRGVYVAKGGWRAAILGRHLGVFVDKTEAARTYDVAAWEMWGEFACLNFPRETTPCVALLGLSVPTSAQARA